MDAHAVLHLPQASIFLAADGVGNTEHGKEGASILAEAVPAYLACALEHKCFSTAFPKVISFCRTLLAAHAQANECALQDYGTTLLIAVALKDWGIATLQIGDGFIVLFDGERIVTVSRQQRREHVNRVICVTSDDYRKELHRRYIRNSKQCKTTGIALGTDGVEELGVYRPKNQAIDGFFRPLFATMPAKHELEQWLRSEQVCRRTGDDKTIVLAKRER